MPTVPYTITIVQIKKNALIIDIQRLPTAPPIEVHPHIGFQIIVEGYWVLKANHLNEIPTQISPQQLLKATPYQRQLDYWRQLLCGQEEQLSLKESHYLDTLTEPELKAVLRQRQVHAYSRQGVSFCCIAILNLMISYDLPNYLYWIQNKLMRLNTDFNFTEKTCSLTFQ